MSTILFGAIMFNLAEVTRMIEVAKALNPTHRAVIFGFEDDYVHLVTSSGFEYHALEPAWTTAEREQALRFDQGRSLRNPFTAAMVASRVEAERALIRATGADAVVVGTNVTSMISARAEKVPLFYPVPFALTGPHVKQTPHLGLVRGAGTLSRGLDRALTRAFRWVYTRAPLAPRSFSRVARANGVPALRTIASLLEADHNLLTVMEPELKGYTLPAGYERVGPIFAHLDAQIPDIVHELAARPEPLVYLGLGSSASRKLTLAVACQLGTLPVNVIAPVGHYVNDDDVLPANIHVTPLLPAHELGGLIDAAVLHGGQGTVQTACATGVPFVGMGLQPEQTWNVAVCATQGNAIALSPRAGATSALPDAVRRLLNEASFREAAARVQREFSAEDGAKASARYIEQRLSLAESESNS
ncbi:MAG: glycosyl transferase family 28 [Ancrocorticia sp.]